MTTATATGIVHLTERMPQISGAEMVAALVPPPQFAGRARSRRTGRIPPSRRSRRRRTCSSPSPGGRAAAARAGSSAAAKRGPELKPGVYLDGGFGVGKTHLLAAVYHAMPARRKYFGSFIEYTALVGALGYKNTVELFRGSDLLCIDEFELDDPGDTMVMTRLLGELVAIGHAAGRDIQHPAERPRRGPVRRAGLPARDPRDVRELPDASASTAPTTATATLDGHADVLERAAATRRPIADAATTGSRLGRRVRRARRAPRHACTRRATSA